MTIADQRALTTSRIPAVLDAIDEDYTRRLEDAHSPLVAAVPSRTEWSLYARRVVEDVLDTFLSPERSTLRTGDDDVPHDVSPGARVATGEVIDGATLLFETALLHLEAEFPGHTFEFATLLLRRLLPDVAQVFTAQERQRCSEQALVHEIVDRDHASALLTKRQLAVFELIAGRANTKAIAAELDISELTVKRHVSEIGARLNARGRPAMLDRARELGFLVAAPLTLSSALAAVNTFIGS